MNAPPFKVGDCGDLGGIRWRVRQGRKGPEDLVLDVEGYDGYVPARMSIGALMADFWFQNEAKLYPPDFGFMGGDRYVNFLLKAVRHGWQAAVDELEREKAAREQRDREAA